MATITRRAALALAAGAAAGPAPVGAAPPVIPAAPAPPPLTAAYVCPLAEVMLASRQGFTSSGIMWTGEITRRVAELTGFSVADVNACWSREPGIRDHLADRDAFCGNLKTRLHGPIARSD